MKTKPLVLSAIALAAACAAGQSMASSHSEAPFTTTARKVDGTDFYMFRSYEGINPDGSGGRSDYITILSNYVPLQEPNAGPNYFALDPNALYEIHLDNNGDGKEDLTFQLRPSVTLRNTALPIGAGAAQQSVAIPLAHSGPISAINDPNVNRLETYTLTLVRGDRRTGTRQVVTTTDGQSTFAKPFDYTGTKTFGDSNAYAAYAAKHIFNITVPGCAAGINTGRVFVGQRQEGFAVNIGPIFDLVNAPLAVITNPANINAAAANSIQNFNVTTFALEIHKGCLLAANEPVLGGWMTASLRQARLLSGAPAPGYQTTEKVGGAWTQVSRLANPLVNELVIGLKDKDRFNGSKPSGDTQFLSYVTNPTLPALLGLVLANNAAALAPTNIPRTDLATVFLTGITGVNKPTTVTPAEIMRLNTSIPPVPYAQQNRLGIVGNILAKGNDNAGYPNGRRPKDDVVDISLVAVLGGLCLANGDNDAFKFNTIPGVAGVASACKPSSVPAGNAALTINDAVDQAAVPFLNGFPYLNTPNPGAR